MLNKSQIDIQKEIINMPEYKLLNRIEAFYMTHEIFCGNYNELYSHLSFFYTSHDAIQLLNINNRNKLDSFLKEVLRLLHNFLASVQSLIDHTRKFYRELYEESNLISDYQSEIDNRFKNNELHLFIIKLRNYCQHYKTPFIQSKINITPKNTERKILLDKENLLKSSFFSNNKYIQDLDELNIFKIVESYYQHTQNFYTWFKEQQTKIHKEDLEKLKIKQEENKKLYYKELPDWIETRIKIFKNLNYPKPDEILFYNTFSSSEFEELKKLDNNDEARFNKAIELLNNKIIVSDELKNKIKIAYKINL